MTARLLFRWLVAGLTLSGLFLVGVWLKNERQARAFQSAESKKLETALREVAVSRLALRPAGLVGPLASGPSNPALEQATLGNGVLGRIEIPRLRISAMIAEGTDPAALQHADAMRLETPVYRTGKRGNGPHQSYRLRHATILRIKRNPISSPRVRMDSG